MTIAHIAFLGLVVGLATARIRQNESESCPKLERDWEEKMDRLIANLPSEVHVFDPVSLGLESLQVFPGLSLSTDRITGLNRLRPDRPYQKFCDNNTRIIAFSLRTTSNIRYDLPWKLCSGQTGNVSVILPSAKFEGELSFTKTWDVRTPDRHLRITPSHVEPSGVFVDGLGDTASEFANVFGVLFVEQLKQLWSSLLRDLIRSALVEVAQDENIRFGNV